MPLPERPTAPQTVAPQTEGNFFNPVADIVYLLSDSAQQRIIQDGGLFPLRDFGEMLDVVLNLGEPGRPGFFQQVGASLSELGGAMILLPGEGVVTTEAGGPQQAQMTPEMAQRLALQQAIQRQAAAQQAQEK